MVQFSTYRDNDRVDYWKLRCNYVGAYDLRRHFNRTGYPYGTESNRARLEYLWSRQQRGLISYEHLTVSQLRDLCGKRGIVIPPTMKGRKGKKKVIRGLLEELDDSGTSFGKLMILPTELRIYIYKLYLNSLQRFFCGKGSMFHGNYESFTLMAPPPLATACHQTRNELVPMWFQHFRWHIEIHTIYRQPKSLVVNRFDQRFFKSAPIEQLRLIEKIWVRAEFYVGGQTCKDDYFEIDLPKSTQAHGRPLMSEHYRSASHYYKPRPNYEALLKRTHDLIELEKKNLLSDISKRKDMRLERGDAEAILRIYQGTISKSCFTQAWEAAQVRAATSGSA